MSIANHISVNQRRQPRLHSLTQKQTHVGTAFFQRDMQMRQSLYLAANRHILPRVEPLMPLHRSRHYIQCLQVISDCNCCTLGGSAILTRAPQSNQQDGDTRTQVHKTGEHKNFQVRTCSVTNDFCIRVCPWLPHGRPHNCSIHRTYT